MKLVISIQGILLRRAWAACALSSLASMYLTMVLSLSHNIAIQESKPSLRASNPTPIEHKVAREPLIRAYEVAFVSQIIKSALPSHPDGDTLAHLIVTESRSANIDPLLVTAVIRAESTFKHTAISNRGARGLMQIMPHTGKYLSKLHNIGDGRGADLHDPRTNIKLGIAYLKELEQRFRGNREQVLIAYNWGPTNLARSLQGGSTPPTTSVKYARTIISHHREWSSSFEQSAPTPSLTALG